MPEQFTTLRDMIQEARDRGASLRDLQARAIDPQTRKTVGKDFIRDLGRGEVSRLPTPEQLRGVAAALGLPYERIREAAIAQWLPPSDEDENERLRLEQLAELKRMRDEADAAIFRLEGRSDGGERAG